MTESRSGSDRRQGERRELKMWLATLRITFEADDAVEAALVANGIAEKAKADLFEDEEIVEVTQVMPLSLTYPIEPTEMVDKMRHVRDMLIATRATECWELAQWIDKTAWLLEHRVEDSGSLAGYDYGTFLARAEEILNRGKKT